MASSLPSGLTRLQVDLLRTFVQRERRFFLTGGAALVGYYFHHRSTDDLDFFAAEPVDLALAQEALRDAAKELGASFDPVTEFADFRRYRIRVGAEECVVDLVNDRSPIVEREKNRFGEVLVDTLREIAANKVCTLIGRSQIRDLVDLKVILEHGIDLLRALEDASHKDASADPLTLAWVLDQIRIGPQAMLPGGTDPVALELFRTELVAQLKAISIRLAARRDR